MKKILVVLTLAAAIASHAIAGEVTARQPQADSTGAETITSTTSGAHQAMDVNVATGTVSLDGTVTATIGDIEVNTEPLTTAYQAVEVSVSATATGTIACGATSSVIIIATDATWDTYYSYTNDASSAAAGRMKIGPVEKFTSPEGMKLSIKTIYLYNAGASTAKYWLECWR